MKTQTIYDSELYAQVGLVLRDPDESLRSWITEALRAGRPVYLRKVSDGRA